MEAGKPARPANRPRYHVHMAKTTINRETFKKLLDALTPMNPEAAEKFVQDLLRQAEERRRDLERVVGDVAKAGVRTAEGIATSVQHEVGRQVTKMAARIDDLERQVESLNKALESTRESLLSLAARSLAKGTSSGESRAEIAKKSGKGSKKAGSKSKKNAEKNTRKINGRSKIASGEASDGPEVVAPGDGATSATGI